jgi:regulator of cell morphogenesis and NO signaling
MNNLTSKTVGEIASAIPAATRIFEKLKIDYCCGGGQSLKEACEAAGLDAEEISRSLEQASHPSASSTVARNWSGQPLSALIGHILATHHVFTRAELARLDPLMAKVCFVHEENHPELEQIRTLFQGLVTELTLHMHKEEEVLFPFIVQMEEAIMKGEAVPTPPFGTLQNPIRMMEMEHVKAGDALAEIREASSDFTLPPDGCASFRALYQALECLEVDLHQHIHLENNILFPRAIGMEGPK